MIVNTEIRDWTQNGRPVLDSYGRCRRLLCVSYVTKEKKVDMFVWPIPENFMYQWKYAKKHETPDPYFQSWDFKPVIKEQVIGDFSEQRVHEILIDLARMYPNDAKISQFNELYIPETTFADIEVNVDKNGFPKASQANNSINTISFVKGSDAACIGLADLSEDDIKWIQEQIDEHCKTFDTKYTFRYTYHKNEISLINDAFQNYIGPAECVSGWNWFGYDWPYLSNRSGKLEYDISWLSPTKTFLTYVPMMAKGKEDYVKIPSHKCMYDYLEIYKKWDQSISPKISNKLDWVAETVLGVKKVAHTLGFEEMWKQQKKEYVFYNVIDSILVREIDKKLKVASIFFGLASLMHTPALTAFSSTKSIEIVQAEYLYNENRVFPKVKKDRMKKDEQYEGAFVFEPEPDLFHYVLTCDYASLYPTTCRQFNISPDTFMFKDKNYVPKADEIKTVSGAVYTGKFKGFIPKILDDFYAKRKSFKKKMVKSQEDYEELEEILKERETQKI